MATAASCCCRRHLAVAAPRAPRLAAAAAVVLASSASGAAAGEPVRRIRRRAPGPQPTQPLKSAPPTQPSVAEVRRAIGLGDDDPSASSRRGERQSAFMELIASTPIGQPEGHAERRLREAAEWVVDTTEDRACQAQKSLLLLCMKIFPLWLLLLSIALGIIKLPFDIPGLDNLLICGHLKEIAVDMIWTIEVIAVQRYGIQQSTKRTLLLCAEWKLLLNAMKCRRSSDLPRRQGPCIPDSPWILDGIQWKNMQYWSSFMPAKEHDDAPADDVEPGSMLFQSSVFMASVLLDETEATMVMNKSADSVVQHGSDEGSWYLALAVLLMRRWYQLASMDLIRVVVVSMSNAHEQSAGMYGHLILSAARRMVLNHGAAPGYCASAPIKGPSMITLLISFSTRISAFA
ncbi:Os09g0306650 [Oryza sativa Japonica Group]|uniref:Os09g0306650 protein n=1 Tax=Oryza sativa subsp. japonica TaxID=39947 RepID=C7J6K1_ORYSJ|nr:Os09g0306650 [Oryza sativa Japonica Group]|eukprot:NP_001175757.1 Os09g0306650 [Oryza sativa Japonica Group]